MKKNTGGTSKEQGGREQGNLVSDKVFFCYIEYFFPQGGCCPPDPPTTVKRKIRNPEFFLENRRPPGPPQLQ